MSNKNEPLPTPEDLIEKSGTVHVTKDEDRVIYYRDVEDLMLEHTELHCEALREENNRLKTTIQKILDKKETDETKTDGLYVGTGYDGKSVIRGHNYCLKLVQHLLKQALKGE